MNWRGIDFPASNLCPPAEPRAPSLRRRRLALPRVRRAPAQYAPGGREPAVHSRVRQPPDGVRLDDRSSRRLRLRSSTGPSRRRAESARCLHLAAAAPSISGLVDLTRTALVGHSVGGKIGLLAATQDSAIDVVVALDPVDGRAGWLHLAELPRRQLAHEQPGNSDSLRRRDTRRDLTGGAGVRPGRRQLHHLLCRHPSSQRRGHRARRRAHELPRRPRELRLHLLLLPDSDDGQRHRQRPRQGLHGRLPPALSARHRFLRYVHHRRDGAGALHRHRTSPLCSRADRPLRAPGPPAGSSPATCSESAYGTVIVHACVPALSKPSWKRIGRSCRQ